MMDSNKNIQQSALDQIESHYKNYGQRAKELQKQGRRAIGYLCALTPVEIITAAGFIPIRIRGNIDEPISKADADMETIVCSLVRCCYDAALKDYYSFIDGLVIPHSCDSACKTYDIWKSTLNLKYSHFINMPHKTDDSSMEFFKSILNTFRQSLGKFSGREISDEALKESIILHNRFRSAIRALGSLRWKEPPKISGVEFLKTGVVCVGLPVEESIELLDRAVDEFGHRDIGAAEKKPRLMIVGPEIDDASIIKLIEDAGSYVVADDICPGRREYMDDIDMRLDPMTGIADRYLRKMKCARTNTPPGDNYPEAIEARFGHIARAIKDFKVDGVILYFYKYCDPFGFDVPAMKSYIESKGVPVLYLEDEYTMSAGARLTTRVQVFLEVIRSSL